MTPRDIEPHLRTASEIQELFPRMEVLSERLCQTQGMVLWALKEAGLTVVLLEIAAVASDDEGEAEAAASESAALRERVAVLDAALRDARLGVENTAAQASLCVTHTGALPSQKEWLRKAVYAEADPVVARIDAALSGAAPEERASEEAALPATEKNQ